MPNITSCPRCASLYEASSDEEANRPDRLCSVCDPPEFYLVHSDAALRIAPGNYLAHGHLYIYAEAATDAFTIAAGRSFHVPDSPPYYVQAAIWTVRIDRHPTQRYTKEIAVHAENR